MSKKIAKNLLFVIFFITAVFSIIEIVISYNIFLDPTRATSSVYLGLQIIIISALIPAISGTFFGVKDPFVPLLISIFINTIIYIVCAILVLLRVIITSYMWLSVTILILKVVVLLILSTVVSCFVKKLVKNEDIQVIDMKNNYAFRRFGKACFCFICIVYVYTNFVFFLYFRFI